MRAVYEAMRLITEHYDLEPGDWFKVTVNAVGNPSIEYGRKITVEGIEKGKYSRETPWREWVGPEENKR